VPLHSDTRAPLVHEAVEKLQGICTKLMELVFEERMRLEKELGDLLPAVSASEIQTQGFEEEGSG